MERTLNSVLFQLDFLRGLLLKKTLRVPAFRHLFTHRSSRLLVFFLIACLIYLPLSLFFPVWIAVIGPIIYGVPHIIASLRYSQPRSTQRLRSSFVGVWTLVTAYRIVTDLGFWDHDNIIGNLDVEIFSVIVTFAIFWLVHRQNQTKLSLGVIKGSLLISMLLLAAWFLPLEFSAFLLLFHNAVAFIYWIGQAKPGSEKITAITSTVIFLGLTAIILLGGFEFLYKYFPPQGFIPRFDLSYEDLGQALAPWSANYKTWFNFFVAYVFGQSLHYFVWLKAIPEQHLPTQTPVSFRTSYEWLARDFGKKLLVLLIISIVSTMAMWLVFNMNEARIIYFAIASYHGFHELAGLPWMKLSA